MSKIVKCSLGQHTKNNNIVFPEQLSQPREKRQKQAAQPMNEVKGKQGAMEELKEANQSLTLAREAPQAAAVT